MVYHLFKAIKIGILIMSEKNFLAGIPDDPLMQLKILGENIREARIARNFTQKELATRALMSKSTYISVEKGEPKTSIGAYIAVLDLLDLLEGLQDIAAPHKDEIGRRYRALKRKKGISHV
jgi:transcriptional regulator with XRE-family HTH domain